MVPPSPPARISERRGTNGGTDGGVFCRSWQKATAPPKQPARCAMTQSRNPSPHHSGRPPVVAEFSWASHRIASHLDPFSLVTAFCNHAADERALAEVYGVIIAAKPDPGSQPSQYLIDITIVRCQHHLVVVGGVKPRRKGHGPSTTRCGPRMDTTTTISTRVGLVQGVQTRLFGSCPSF